jgi:hypothetical protein
VIIFPRAEKRAPIGYIIVISSEELKSALIRQLSAENPDNQRFVVEPGFDPGALLQVVDQNSDCAYQLFFTADIKDSSPGLVSVLPDDIDTDDSWDFSDIEDLLPALWEEIDADCQETFAEEE